jgi:hypothetical protein
MYNTWTSGERWMNLRGGDAASWVVRTAARRSTQMPYVSLYWPDYLAQEGGNLDTAFLHSGSFVAQPDEQGPFYASYDAAVCATELRTALAVKAADPEVPLLMIGLPRACRPPFGDAVLPQLEMWDRVTSMPSTGNTQSRLAILAMNSLFGVRPFVGLEELSPASLILALESGTGGLVFNEPMADSSGFPSLVKNIDSALASAGTMKVLHEGWLNQRPSGGSSDAFGVGPLMIAMLPAEPSGDNAVFIGFLGVSGSVSIDPYNIMTVSWDGGSEMLQLPPGIWQVQNPDPANIASGDVAVVTKRFLTAPGEPTGNADI